MKNDDREMMSIRQSDSRSKQVRAVGSPDRIHSKT